MDIRRPKDIHSLREFAIEIATITLGILIALGLEAAVEAWRHHEVVEHARAELRLELTDDRATLATALASQKAAVGEIDKMLAVVGAQLAGRTVPPPQSGLALRTPTLPSSAWQSAVSTQAFSYMPFGEAQAVSSAYAGIQKFNQLQEDARRPWFELAVIAADGTAGMTPGELRDARHQLLLSRNYLLTSVGTAMGVLKGFNRALARLH